MQTFTLTDRDGNRHDYSCTPHGAMSGGGLQLMLDVADVVGGVMGAALKAMVGMGDAAESTSIDLTDISALAENLPRRLMTAGGPKLIARVLENTKRCDDSGKWVILSSETALDTAYTGNYGELFRAVWEVLCANFSPFGKDGLHELKGLWQRLTQETQTDQGAV